MPSPPVSVCRAQYLLLVPWAGWLVSAQKLWLADVLPCSHLAPTHSTFVLSFSQRGNLDGLCIAKGSKYLCLIKKPNN